MIVVCSFSCCYRWVCFDVSSCQSAVWWPAHMRNILKFGSHLSFHFQCQRLPIIVHNFIAIDQRQHNCTNRTQLKMQKNLTPDQKKMFLSNNEDMTRNWNVFVFHFHTSFEYIISNVTTHSISCCYLDIWMKLISLKLGKRFISNSKLMRS